MKFRIRDIYYPHWGFAFWPVRINSDMVWLETYRYYIDNYGTVYRTQAYKQDQPKEKK